MYGETVGTRCAKRIKAQKQKEVPFFAFCLGSIHFANTFQELKRHFDVCENSGFDSMWGFDFPDDFDSEESEKEDLDWVKCSNIVTRGMRFRFVVRVYRGNAQKITIHVSSEYPRTL